MIVVTSEILIFPPIVSQVVKLLSHLVTVLATVHAG